MSRSMCDPDLGYPLLPMLSGGPVVFLALLL